MAKLIKKSGNIGTLRVVKTSAIMKPFPFVRGFNDVKNTIPFDYDAYSSKRDMVDYERGRHFACVFFGKLKEGRTVTMNAIYAFNDAWHDGSILQENKNVYQ